MSLTKEAQKAYIIKVAQSWYKEGYGPKPKSDRTGGYYLACTPEEMRDKDFHVHLVGPDGKFHPNSWSRKVNVRRRWETLDFRLTPKETAFRIYVKSEFRGHPKCKNKSS